MSFLSKAVPAFLLLGLAGASFADSLAECYKAADNRVQVRQCLQKELDQTRRDYEEKLAFAQDQAKSLDDAQDQGRRKKRGQGPASQALSAANRAFDGYLRRQCDFESAMFGSGTGSGNQLIACRINLMKLRMGALDNLVGADTRETAVPK
ncbi:MAG: hypothetical protein MR009_01330 [Sutterellaceae bacterium]|nr:hypothetical protein [Sutterellaceae bacterium]MDD7443085.1 hypothetical protein [Sutterellaceae bacterium]MDY2868783.1 hypothetical protein [Mesosutterella sp.]